MSRSSNHQKIKSLFLWLKEKKSYKENGYHKQKKPRFDDDGDIMIRRTY